MPVTNNSNWTWQDYWALDYREQIQLAVRAGLELRASELQVQRSNHSAILSSHEIFHEWLLSCDQSE